jgi:peptidoglycan-N-acetylglucosamine deacetylase
MPKRAFAAVGGAAVALLLAPAAALAAPPLTLEQADLTVSGPSQVQLIVRTAEPWTPTLLAAEGRSLCLRLLAARSNEGERSACVRPRATSPRAELAIGAQTVKGAVGRPDDRSLRVRFTPAAVGLKAGEAFRWQVVSTGDGQILQRPDDAAAAMIPPPVPTGCRATGASVRTHGPTNRKVVALTFDDGPAPITGRFLDLMEREQVPGTFFMLGSQVGGRQTMLKRMLAAGFELANHSWSHADLGRNPGRAPGEIRSTNAIIRRASGYTPCLFRPPYGSIGGGLAGAARGQGMLSILWDVDPQDWRTPGAGAIAARILSATRPGSIILMHDGGGPRGQTLFALGTVIRTLKARGYRFKTVSDLLGLRPTFG